MSAEHDRAPEQALAWIDDGKGAALATVIETWGSAPRPVGSQLAISSDAEIYGSVSGGCVEGAVVAEALDALESGDNVILEYGVSNEEAFAVGLACGGTIRVLVEPVGVGRGLPEDMLRTVVERRSDKTPIAIATDVGAVGASYVIKGKDKKPVASFHRVKEENKDRRASFVLKVHPTRKEEIGDSTDLAPAGTWRLKIEVQRRSGVFVSAQVQRGDTPGSFRRLGRQSYLDHEYAGTRDDRTGKFEAPGNSGLTRLGTHSSAATTPTAGFYTIGAAFGQSAYVARYCVEPTFYASSGAPDPRLSTSNQPSLSAVADASAIRNGVLGSGTVSGSARMVSGTSVAAPQAARRLVSYLDRNAVFGVEINPTDEKNFVLYDGVMIRGGHRRLGKGVMAPPSRQKRPAKLPTI